MHRDAPHRLSKRGISMQSAEYRIAQQAEEKRAYVILLTVQMHCRFQRYLSFCVILCMQNRSSVLWKTSDVPAFGKPLQSAHYDPKDRLVIFQDGLTYGFPFFL